jgi:hypothetical protein
MPLNVVVGGGEYAVSSVIVYPGGVAKTVRRVEAWNGSAWKVVRNFAPPLGASAKPNVLSSDINGVTRTTTATPVGGLPPYTYAWTQTGGQSAGITAPNFATTAFFAPTGGNYSASFVCVVTDSLGATATANVSVFFQSDGNPL